MRPFLTIPPAAVAGWGVCCVFYAISVRIAFPAARTFDEIYWESFYTAWSALAFSIVVLGTLALAPKLRRFVFKRPWFIAVGLLGGMLTYPLGVIGWSMLMYGSIYMPWLVPSRGFDIPMACIVGLSCITLYGLFLGSYSIRPKA
jgi:hypothetical protein